MRKTTLLLSICLCMATTTCMAGTRHENNCNGESEGGKTKLYMKLWDTDGAVSSALLISGTDTTDLAKSCNDYAVVDLPNHLMTICFQQRGTTTDDTGARTIKVWAIPSSFVKLPGGSDNSWRFKAKTEQFIQGKLNGEAVTLSCTYRDGE